MKNLLFLKLALLSFITSEAAPDKKGAYSSPEDASKDPDFSIQGEYKGSYTKSNGNEAKVGIQVIALGNGMFRAVGFEGGLPGDGWDLGERAKSEAQKNDDGTVTFKKDDGVATATIKKGKFYIKDGDGKVLGALHRVERKSPTLGLKAPDNAIKLFDGSSLEH